MGRQWFDWVEVRTVLVVPPSVVEVVVAALHKLAVHKLAEARRTPRKLAEVPRILAGLQRPPPHRSKSSQPRWSPAANPDRCSHRCSL